MTRSTLSIRTPQLKLLERLCNASAVSGDEGEVRKIVLERVKPVADEVRVDALGNVLVTRRGSGRNRLRVMLAAHMDEVGFMIVSDEGEGVYSFEAVGSIDERQMAGKPVWVGRDRVPGVIGVRPIHLLKGEERNRKVARDALRIDIGPGGGKVKVGDRAVFAASFQRVGPSIIAKAIDDRIGVATLIELVEHAPPNIDLLAAFTVQEEVGLRGAKVAAHALDPQIGIAIDSTPAYDLPTQDGSENAVYNTKLGGGPAIYVADAASVNDPRLIRFFEETARKAEIPFQFRQPGGGGTDAGAIHKQLEGIPSISISVPGRYAHTAAGLCRVEDWKNTLLLLHTALARITPALLKR